MRRRENIFDEAGSDEKPPSHIMVHLDTIYDSRKLIAIITASVLLNVGIGYAFLAKPIYRADVANHTARRTNRYGLIQKYFE